MLPVSRKCFSFPTVSFSWSQQNLVLLPGIVSDCGINAHKHCKDLVVMECRSKASVACNRRLDSLSSNGKISLCHCHM